MRANHSRGNIFVANLPPEFTDDELAEIFDSFGIVLSASILQGDLRSGWSRERSPTARIRLAISYRACSPESHPPFRSNVDRCRAEVERAFLYSVCTLTPASTIERSARSTEPSLSVPRQAVVTTATSKPAPRPSIAEKATQKSVASPHRVTRSNPRSLR